MITIVLRFASAVAKMIPISFFEIVRGSYLPQKAGHFILIVPPDAQVAELADALGSGPSGSNLVQVRFLSWASLFGTAFFEELHFTLL